MLNSESLIQLAVAGAVISLAYFGSKLRKRAPKSSAFPQTDASFTLPDIGSPFTSAMVIYDSSQISLDTTIIADIISQSSNNAAAKAEDVLLPDGEVFPLVRVTAPIACVVVIDDVPDVIVEIKELADEMEENQQLSRESIDNLRKCNARLGISAPTFAVKELEDAIKLAANTNLDPQNPAFRKLLFTLQDATHGQIFDCVNGKWLERP